jgi:hypothetical protein
MKELEISPNFTTEDIRKIREYDAERYWSMPKEEFWAEVRTSSSSMQEKIEDIRKNRIAQEKYRIEQVV